MEMEGGKNCGSEMYRECQRNHAASLGSYATDGCGEFTLPHNASAGSLNCAACGCHRNFHRKITFSHHARGDHPEMMMDCGGASGGGGDQGRTPAFSPSPECSNTGRKRFRTKFTEEQKEKMVGFAEYLGWKLQRKDEEDEIERFCRGIGITRKVFKVWMHNHKNSSSPSPSASTGNASSLTHDHQ